MIFRYSSVEFVLNRRRKDIYIIFRAITGGDQQAYRLIKNSILYWIFNLQAVRSWGGAVK